MRIIEKYIAKTVYAAIGLVTLMLSGLEVFILMVNQIGDIGKGNYHIFSAFWFVLCQLPTQVYLFFPVASLLGSLIGLGALAHHYELVAMRANGYSKWDVTRAVLKASAFFILGVTLIGETIVPELARYANGKKIEAMHRDHALQTAHGLWLRQGNNFITIGSVISNNELHQVVQFQFDDQHHLKFVRHLERIFYENKHWRAENVEESYFNQSNVEANTKTEMDWDVPLNPTILSASIGQPEMMNLIQLRRYLWAQKKSHQNVADYQLDYWTRIAQPLATIVMMMLGIPFIFGPLRSSTMGSKLLVGAMMGFGFHMANRFFGPLSQVFDWPIPVAAFLPTALFACLGIYLMRRI